MRLDRIGRQPQPLARLAPRAGLEDGKVDPGVDRPDPRGVGIVEPDQLPGLLDGVGHQPVRRCHHLCLAPDPHLGLGGITGRERRVLDPPEGMHGLHEGNPPAFLGNGADLAGQPVVAVHKVVPARRVRGLGAQHLKGELAQLAGQVGLVQVLERAGRQGDRAGEDLHFNATLGKAAGDLDNVDIQAARVACSRLLER